MSTIPPNILPIYIPSRSRFDNLRGGPIPFFSEEVRARTTFVVTPEERPDYQRAVDFHKLSVKIVAVEYGDHIGLLRQRIGELAAAAGHDRFVMFDDDVELYQRKSPELYNLRYATKDDSDHMLAAMSSQLDEVVSVGISDRKGNNNTGAGHALADNLVQRNTRLMRVVGFRTEDFLACEHDRLRVMEDHDIQLQLLRKGETNVCLYYWANGQKMTNAPGGCRLWRTHEIHDESARRLAELHPGFVRLTHKKNKTDANGFGTRTEVVIAWKAANGSGGTQLPLPPPGSGLHLVPAE